MQTILRVLALTSALALLGGCASPNHSGPNTTVTKTLNETVPVPANTRLSVENLVGHVQVSQGGPQLQVTATVVAGGKNQAAAQALANSIRLDVQRSQGQILIHVDYPVGAHDRYQYIPTHPEQQQHDDLHVLGFNIDISSSNSSLTYQTHDVRVYQGTSRGVPLHVDLNVKLPAGADGQLFNHVGRIQAQNLKNALTLQTDSGDISARTITGHLRIKSGSGDIRIIGQNGPADIHTGSGDVTARQVAGSVDLHTGSGDVQGHDLHGQSLTSSTGSGDIKLNGISGTLKLDAGSGDITLTNLAKIPDAHIETGSGDLVLRGNLSGLQAFDLQTGSGDVTLASSHPPTVHLDIHGSDISTRWPGIRNVQSRRHHFSGDIGAATGKGSIHTGSGDVTLEQ